MGTVGTGSAIRGEILVEYARMFGFPEDAVVTTDKVMNTAGEAEAVAALFKARGHGKVDGAQAPWKILLVTSAFHMPLARTNLNARVSKCSPSLWIFWFPRELKSAFSIFSRARAR